MLLHDLVAKKLTSYQEGFDNLDDRKDFLHRCLLPFLTFEHIKWGEDTAWPMPYKYLREYINLYLRETDARM